MARKTRSTPSIQPAVNSTASSVNLNAKPATYPQIPPTRRILGRSVSAHPNERRSDLLPGNRCPHSLVGLAPRMVFFRLPHHHGPGARGKRGRGFLGLLLQLRKSDCFSAVVHLHGSVLPLADQSLASCGPIAS